MAPVRLGLVRTGGEYKRWLYILPILTIILLKNIEDGASTITDDCAEDT